MLAGARGFDGGIKRKQIGLIRDVFNRIDDLFDL